MGLWSAYFLAKLALYAFGYMDFSPWLNLALAIFTAVPAANARQRLTKNLIAVPLAILLFYHDTWLPPFAELLKQLQNLRAFSASYLWELAGRVISLELLVGAAVMLALYALARRKLRMSTFVFLGILAVITGPEMRSWTVATPKPAAAAAGLATTGASTETVDLAPAALDARLSHFYAEQNNVHIRFARPAPNDPSFDILILHVCSLSWDDLKMIKVAPDTFLGHFDLVLTNFNSAASYSGPAAIRLLRGTCGQTPEARLYDPTGDGCLVIDGLQNAGFEPHWTMNHDGHYGNFFADVRQRGGVSVPLEEPSGATTGQIAFDGTPVYDDYSVLSRWWAKRLMNRAPRIVLYYNTISLHDGNRVAGSGHPDSSYGARFATFSREIVRFLDLLRASGRNAVVVLIAEHGSNVGGDRRQIPGLREIPTAAIAHVPVAIALINAARPAPVTPSRIDAPASYPAVNEILSRFIANDPFAAPVASLEPYVSALPRADFVAENNGTTVVQAGSHYMMRSPDGSWSSLDGIDARSP